MAQKVLQSLLLNLVSDLITSNLVFPKKYFVDNELQVDMLKYTQPK